MPKKAPEKIGSVLRVPLSQLHPHPQNPFAVRDDSAMQELKESVSQNGVLVPAIARPRAEGGYELIAGHRRKYACEQADPACVLRYFHTPGCAESETGGHCGQPAGSRCTPCGGKCSLAEQEKFRDWLKGQPPEEVLNHAYEYTIREDILVQLNLLTIKSVGVFGL